jgi:hypothetical protein
MCRFTFPFTRSAFKRKKLSALSRTSIEKKKKDLLDNLHFDGFRSVKRATLHRYLSTGAERTKKINLLLKLIYWGFFEKPRCK